MQAELARQSRWFLGPYIRLLVRCQRDSYNQIVHLLQRSLAALLMLAWSASLKEKRDSSSASVASRLVMTRDCPTQLRAPSAKGK